MVENAKMSYRHQLFRSEANLAETQKDLEETQKGLEESQKGLEETQKELEETQKKLKEMKLKTEMLENMQTEKEELSHKMSEYQKNAEIWKHQRDIVYQIILIFHGLLFGGAAIVFAMHDYWVGEFAKFFSEETEEYDRFLYNDPTCHPLSYEGRTQLPKDYDFYMTESNYEKMLEYLKPLYNIVFVTQKESYFCNKQFLNHVSFSISPKKNHLHMRSQNKSDNFTMVFDVVYLKKDYENNNSQIVKHAPPYRNGLDFQCNGLCLRRSVHGQVELGSISKKLERSRKFTSLIKILDDSSSENEAEKVLIERMLEDNKNKIAVMVGYSGSLFRVQKMIHKGYKIDIYKFVIDELSFKEKEIPSEDEVCCLCQSCDEDFKTKYISVCPTCKTKLHLPCFTEYILNIKESGNGFCMGCRESIRSSILYQWNTLLPLLEFCYK